MATHLFFLILMFVLCCSLFFTVGLEVKQKQMKREFNLSEDKYSWFKLHTPGASIGPLVMFVACTFFWVCASYESMRDYYCERYESGKIVKEITYKYREVNGEKVLKDSTISYISYKEK